MTDAPSYRLPRTVLPQRYRLEFAPDLARDRFDGQAVIDVTVVETTRTFALNAVGLALGTPTLEGSGERLEGEAAYEESLERVTLTWPEPVTPGAWRLTLAFSGSLQGDLRGLYRTSVPGPNGRELRFASTQCCPSDARRVFPCWDEPDMKAVFSVTLEVGTDEAALSNGRELASEPAGEGRRRVRFADTMPMSTYLFALVVGPIEALPAATADEVPVRVWARPDLLPLTHLARAEAVACLEHFSRYFDLPCPVDKLDHVAIPDFAFGAMENLGCVTYREEAVLVDDERSSPAERRRVASTITHETAHMWFGDLVTMRWWNGIWLNEAFATFMQLLASDALHPDWQVWERFAASRAEALRIDGLSASRAVDFPVVAPGEAMSMLDVLTYQKGAGLLHMLERYLGGETFRRGIGVYLRRHRHGNTETADLWAALEAVSATPVAAVMRAWVGQPGVPEVRATRSPDGQTLTLSQSPFRYGGEGQGTWQVPVALALGRPDGTRETIRLLLAEEPAALAWPEDAAWLVLNAGGSGYFRCAYEDGLWPALLAAWGHLDAVERFCLADDAWAGLMAGRLRLPEVLAVWARFDEDTGPDLWEALVDRVGLLDDLAGESARPALRAFVRALAGSAFAALGWQPRPGEGSDAGRVRAALLTLLGAMGGDRAIQAEARRRLRAHAKGADAVDPSLLSAVASVTGVSGGASDWQLLHDLYRESVRPQDRVRYLLALTQFSDPDLAGRTLALCLSSDVRGQDAPAAIARLLRSRCVGGRTWAALEARWAELTERLPRLGLALAGAVAYLVEPEPGERAASWLAEHRAPEFARQLAQGLELRAVHLALAARLGPEIGDAMAAAAQELSSARERP